MSTGFVTQSIVVTLEKSLNLMVIHCSVNIFKIYSWLHDTTSSCPPSLRCTVSSIGNSYEGRDLPVIKVSEFVYYLKPNNFPKLIQQKNLSKSYSFQRTTNSGTTGNCVLDFGHTSFSVYCNLPMDGHPSMY